MDDLFINDRITIPAEELRVSFARSSGPGGQNVNKVNSKVDLRWNLQDSQSVSFAAKKRIRELAGSRYLKDGTIQFQADEHRDQTQNLAACRARLKRLIIRGMRPPVQRKPTKPTRGSIQRRLKDKKARAMKKENRRRPRHDD